MTPPDQERLDAMSEALARLVREQRELESRIRFLESQAGFVPQRINEARQHGALSAVPPPLTDHSPQPAINEARPSESAPSPPPLHDHSPQPAIKEARQHGARSTAADEAHSAPPPLPEPELETQVGLTWINRIAVVTLIFGTAFGFKYAVDAGYIGPAMRVALGIAAAIASLFFGDRMWRRGHAVFSQGLMGLGIALLYLSFYASFTLYFLLPQSAAFSFMALTTVAAGFMGVQYESQTIAMLGMLGGYLTPVLLSTGEDHPWFLFSYTFALNVGGLAFTRIRRWPATEFLSFAATIILFTAWFGNSFNAGNHVVAATFAIAFYAQFAAATARPIVFVAQFLAAIAAIAIGDKPPQLIYLTLVFAAGGLAVAEFRRWRETPPVTLFCFWLANVTWLGIGRVSIDPVHAFGLLSIGFAIFFAWLLWWAVLCRRELRGTDLTMFVTNAATYFAASYYLLNPSNHGSMGYFAVLLAVIHGGAASLLSRHENRNPSALATGIALAFLTLAIPIQFTSFSITIAWALQAAALSWLADRYKKMNLNLASWLVFALVLTRLITIDSLVDSGAFGLRFVTFTVSAVALWLAAKFTQTGLPAAAPYVAGHFVMLWNLGMEVVAYVQRSNPTEAQSIESTAISILMALYALMLIVLGVATRTVLNRVLGLGLMGIVIAKLYLSDIWLLSLVFRIAAFLGLGVLLLLVSYLYSKFKPAIQRLWKGDQVVE